MDTATRRSLRRRRIELSEQRAVVRIALDKYEDMLVEAIQATDNLHNLEGGQRQKLIDLHASLTQVKSAKRVLWFEG